MKIKESIGVFERKPEKEGNRKANWGNKRKKGKSEPHIVTGPFPCFPLISQY